MSELRSRSLWKIIAWMLLLGLVLSLGACNPPTSPRPETGASANRRKTASPMPSPSPVVQRKPTRTPTQAASRNGVDPVSFRGAILQFWHIWPGEVGERLKELIDAFNTSNEWGILVVATYQGDLDELDAKIGEGLNSGKLPDIAVGYHYQARAWDSVKKLVDLQKYMDDPLWGLTAQEQADFYPAFWEQDLAGERRLGLPALRYAQFIYYNVTWARELGFKQPPETPEEFQKQACTAARANQQDSDPRNDKTGGYILSTDYSASLGWMSSFGAEVAQVKKSTYLFDSPHVEQTFQFLRDLYDAGCAWLPEGDSPEAGFAARWGLFASGSLADLPYQAAALQLAGNSDEWTVIPFPSPIHKLTIATYGPAYVVFPSTPEKQIAAWMFLRWLLAPQNQAKLVEVTGAFPLRASSLEELKGFRASHLQWAAAVDLLSYARPEPALGSWAVVRWAVSDAAVQLFKIYFGADGKLVDQVPIAIELLVKTAAELSARTYPFDATP